LAIQSVRNCCLQAQAVASARRDERYIYSSSALQAPPAAILLDAAPACAGRQGYSTNHDLFFAHIAGHASVAIRIKLRLRDQRQR
jgi:hypothetical protein